MEHSKEAIEISKLKGRLIELDKKVERKEVQSPEIKEWARLSSRLSELEKMVSIDLREKSRLKWLTDGDENTKFFHGFVNNRNRKNTINELMLNGQWTSQPDVIKDEVFKFFSAKFKEQWKARPEFKSNGFKKLSSTSSELLEGCVSKDEVKRAVWECGNDKAPGSDGFTFNFTFNVNEYDSLWVYTVLI